MIERNKVIISYDEYESLKKRIHAIQNDKIVINSISGIVVYTKDGAIKKMAEQNAILAIENDLLKNKFAKMSILQFIVFKLSQ